ncbi:MAG TPA: 5-deoxy-glucuronate isomerase [Acidimicrobiia bacterium]|jgi:5-deoxy-glucuronate isomerase
MTRLFHPSGTLSSEHDPVHLTASQAGWEYCGLDVVVLAPAGRRRLDTAGVEALVVPLTGWCRVEAEDASFDLVGRPSVFSGIPDVAYVAPGTEATISSVEGGRFAVATARADWRTPSFKVEAATISVELRGAGRSSRQINGLLPAATDGPHRLMVVEVITPAGNWSSYPPHKHDEWSDREVPVEEIYYFELSGEAGFGMHRTYTLDGVIDETVTVRSGDVFLVPRGYHGPCAAAPGYDLYYLNVMAGPDEQRRWRICTDPAHDWLWDAWDALEPDPRLPMTAARQVPTTAGGGTSEGGGAGSPEDREGT